MQINERVKKVLFAGCAVVAAVAVGAWLLLSGPDHIEDTNGADNFALQEITEANIVNLDVGSIGGPKISRSFLTGDMVEFSAKKFTGVYEVLYDNFILPSDFVVEVSGFSVNGGNFKMAVVHDDQIVATLEPDLFVDYRLENVTGTVSLVIAGESADFCFSMSEIEYDYHTHP